MLFNIYMVTHVNYVANELMINLDEVKMGLNWWKTELKVMTMETAVPNAGAVL